MEGWCRLGVCKRVPFGDVTEEIVVDSWLFVVLNFQTTRVSIAECKSNINKDFIHASLPSLQENGGEETPNS